MKKLLLTMVTLSCPLIGMEEIKSNNRSAARNAVLMYCSEGFKAREDGVTKDIQSHRVDKDVRNLDRTSLNKYLANGYLTLDKNQDGEYSVKADGRLKGGNEVLGLLFYGATYLVLGGAQVVMTRKAAKAVGASKDSCKMSNPRTGTEHVITNNGDGSFTDHSRKLIVDCSGTPMIHQPVAGIITNLGVAQAMSRPGMAGVAAAGASAIEMLPQSTQNGIAETTFAVNVVSGGQALSWIDRAANAAYNFGKAIPGKL